MTTFIDAQRVTFGVEPICQTLEIAPSSYYAAKARPPSARSCRYAALNADISRIHQGNYAVYGARKLWRALRREGTPVGRDQVARLMRGLGLAGAVRGKVRRTTVPSERGARSPFRSRGPVPRDPLHRAPRQRGCRDLGRQQGRQL